MIFYTLPFSYLRNLSNSASVRAGEHLISLGFSVGVGRSCSTSHILFVATVRTYSHDRGSSIETRTSCPALGSHSNLTSDVLKELATTLSDHSWCLYLFITCISIHFGSHRSLPEVAGEVTLGAVFVELAVVLSLSGSSGIRYRLVHGHVTIIPFIVRFVVAENLSDSNWLSICKI